MNVDTKTMATWLLVGWQRGWRFRQVLEAVSFPIPHSAEEAEKIAAQFAFMPADWVAYAAHGGDVREWVGASWPKLSMFLRSNSGDPEKLAGIVPQLMRLSGMVRPGDRRKHNGEVNETRTAERHYRQAVASYGIVRDSKRTQSRSAWNTCKGGTDER